MEDSKKPQLKPLHPEKLNDKDFAIYKEELNCVFHDPLCRNIAVSGPYGAGKSSLIEKVKEKYSDLNWISVSLATFGKEEGADDDETENAVEAEVLRQIIYKINPAKAPKSRLHKTQDTGRLRDLGIALYALLFITSCLLLSSCFSNFLSGIWSWFDIAVIALWMVLLFLGVYQIVRHNVLSKFVKSFKFLNTEIEIQSENQTPYDRCIDELVYLLNSSEIDAVIFEDLDRFNNLSIFQKMRSLNELANEDREDSESKPLRFFYLIKDSLFEEPRDRTKFFDYVIPVIPYVDPNNALDIFRKALEGVGIEVDDGFLFQLSSYIDDPRIIHNIVDEAYHYKQMLFRTRQAIENDWENLIAILAYKAMFPKDFEHLQIGRGYLYEVINGRGRLIDDIRNWGDKEIENLEREVKRVDNQLQMSENELLILFALPKLVKYIYNGYGSVASQLQSATTAAEVMEAVQSHNNTAAALAEIKEDLEKNNCEYNDRLLEVRNNAHSLCNANRTRIKEIKDTTASLQSCTIKQLVERASSADALFLFDANQIGRPEDYEDLKMEDVVKNPSFPLLRFLVVEGWINEDYRRYLSKNHGLILSARDDDFLASLIQARNVDVEYKPDQPCEVLRRLSNEVFARTRARNPWLIAELLKSGDNDKISTFMASVERNGGDVYIAELIVSEQFVPEMFERFMAYFENLIISVLESSDIDFSQKRAFARRYIAYGGDNYKKEKVDGAFADWINHVPLLLESDASIDIEALKAGLRVISYSPKDIDLTVASRQLIRFIYDEKLFAPDARIADKLLSAIFEIPDALSDGVLVTEVLALDDGCISEVVAAGLDEFVTSTIENVPASIKDSTETILAILNSNEVKKETAGAYILKLDSGIKIPKLADVESKENRIKLFEKGCVSSTTNNLVCYYVDCGFCVNEQFGRFLSANTVPEDLKLSTIEALDIDTNEHDFTEGLIRCTTITTEQLKALLSQYGVCYERLDIDDFSEEKIAVLIHTGTISMNDEMLQSVRKHGVELAARFAIANINEYIDLVSASADGARACSFSVDEMFVILNSEVDEKKKLLLLNEHTGAVSLKENYPESLKIAIVEEHFDEADLQKLSDWYDDSSINLQKCVIACFLSSIDGVKESVTRISLNLVSDLSEAMAQNRDETLKFLIWYCEGFLQTKDRSRMIDLFKVAKLPEYAMLLAGTNTMITNSTLDDQLLDALHAKGLCGTIKHDENSEGKRMVYKKGNSINEVDNKL